MADPQTALLTQLRNIQARSGRSIAELHAALDASGFSKHGEKRAWLMAQFQLGHGDANTVVHAQGQPELMAAVAAGGASVAPAAPAGDALESIYAGPKAALRPVHDAVMAAIDRLGNHERAPKKSYVSLRRRKQFAMVGPATKELIEIGLNVKDLPPHPRLKAMPPGGMCNYTVRLGAASEVDAELQRWLKAAYDAAA